MHVSFEGGIFYAIGEKTYRPLSQGALAVFDTYQNAYNFHRKVLSHSEIWECEYKEESCAKAKQLFYRPNISYTTEEGFWFYIERFRGEYPKGTKLARWVKLLERVG